MEMQKTENINSPAELIKIAVAGNADLEKLSKLLDIQERWEQSEARKAYYQAIAEFKANPPQIFKDKTVAFGQTKYNHASLGNVVEKITARLSECGLSHSWRIKQNGVIEVFCRITHVKGHYEETSISANADKSGAKNDIQSIGSAITYLQRYTLLAMTGLATEEQGDDGRTSTPIEYINETQFSVLTDYMAATNTAEGKFLAWLKVESLEKLPSSEYMKALNALKAKEAKK